MREIFEEAAIIYRQEAENLLFIVAPAVILGPILVMVSTAGLTAALVCIPLLLLVFLAAYCASVRAAGLIAANMTPDPAASYIDALRGSIDIVRAAAPGGLLLAAFWGVALAVSDQGLPEVALLLGLAGAVAAFVWGARHAFDVPIILVHDGSASDASRFGLQLADGLLPRSITLVATVAAPLLAAGLLSLGLGALKPAFGGAVFAAAVAVWLPFGALSLTIACERLLDDPVETTRLPASAGR